MFPYNDDNAVFTEISRALTLFRMGWTKSLPQPNPYKIEVVITSLTEMLELPNFGHMNTATI